LPEMKGLNIDTRFDVFGRWTFASAREDIHNRWTFL
jgi:hypothetical protein